MGEVDFIVLKSDAFKSVKIWLHHPQKESAAFSIVHSKAILVSIHDRSIQYIPNRYRSPQCNALMQKFAKGVNCLVRFIGAVICIAINSKVSAFESARRPGCGCSGYGRFRVRRIRLNRIGNNVLAIVSREFGF